jgi:hypothetical protein
LATTQLRAAQDFPRHARNALFSGAGWIDVLDSAEPISRLRPQKNRGLKNSAGGARNAPRHARDLHNPLSKLAARARLGHIRLYGDVAEWLKAAVC